MSVTNMGMYAICHNITRYSKKWKGIIIDQSEMQQLARFQNTRQMRTIEAGKIEIYISGIGTNFRSLICTKHCLLRI